MPQRQVMPCAVKGGRVGRTPGAQGVLKSSAKVMEQAVKAGLPVLILQLTAASTRGVETRIATPVGNGQTASEDLLISAIRQPFRCDSFE